MRCARSTQDEKGNIVYLRDGPKRALWRALDRLKEQSRTSIREPGRNLSMAGWVEAVRIASDSEYGLGGSVWTADDARARRVAARVQTGTIGINGYVPAIGSPFGGIRASGLGRELGPEALAMYQQVKSTYVMA